MTKTKKASQDSRGTKGSSFILDNGPVMNMFSGIIGAIIGASCSIFTHYWSNETKKFEISLTYRQFLLEYAKDSPRAQEIAENIVIADLKLIVEEMNRAMCSTQKESLNYYSNCIESDDSMKFDYAYQAGRYYHEEGFSSYIHPKEHESNVFDISDKQHEGLPTFPLPSYATVVASDRVKFIVRLNDRPVSIKHPKHGLLPYNSQSENEIG